MRDVRRDYGQGAPIEIDDPSKPLELLSKWVQDAIDAGVTAVSYTHLTLPTSIQV